MTTETIGSKFSVLTEVRFTYTDGGRWHEIAVDCRELLSILQTGKIDDKPICAVEVVTVTDKETVSYIYDFVLLAQSLNPWRIV